MAKTPRTPPKTKSELRDMLTEAARNTLARSRYDQSLRRSSKTLLLVLLRIFRLFRLDEWWCG
jgi:hypothetical protein